MEQRAAEFGQEPVGVDVHKKKRFKFGNAQERNAESYVILPQVIQGSPLAWECTHSTSLVYQSY